MMWLIKNNKGDIFCIRGDREITVGRKETDIILKDDKSISKKHCILKVIRDETQGTSRLIAKDAGSKYKSTLIKNSESSGDVTIGDETELHHLSKIKFGLQDHIFIVQKLVIKICTSQLTSEDSAELEKYKKILDAFIFNKWRPDCTHLTTSKPTLTQKVVQALIANLHIVDMSYWRSFIRAIEAKSKLPHPDNFLLSMSDDFLKENITLSSQRERMSLFTGLTFLTFSKRQYKNFVDIIEAAGGKIILYKVQNDNTKIDVLDKNVIVLQLTTEATQYNDELTNEYMTISKLLNHKKFRVISETEIPLAVLYCSTEQHCNPTYDFRKLLQPSSSKVDKVKNSDELAPDTQDVRLLKPKTTFVAPRSVAKDHDIVPETQDPIQTERQTETEKTELRRGFRNEKLKCKNLNPEQDEIIPESEEMQVSTIVSASNKTQSSKSSYHTGNDILEMDDWDDVPSSTQKGSSGTEKSMEVECLTVKDRKLDSLFTDSDNRQLSIWNKEPDTQKNRQMDTETATKKRKRHDEINSVADFGEDLEIEKNVSTKKLKTDQSKSMEKKTTGDLSEQAEVLEFDDWGLDDHNGFQEVQKFGFLLSGQSQKKNKDNNFEIQIEKRSAPVKNKEKLTPVVEPAVASTSGIQTKKSIPEKPNKRPAGDIITLQTPEKRRRVDDTKNNHSIEQVTRNIENITVDESNFSVVNVNYYSQFKKELPLLRPGSEKALTRENFLKTFKKVYALPIERVQI